MKVESFEFTGEGLKRVFENEKWTVAIKNWKPANDISQIDNIERHLETDELFVLLEGKCTIAFVNISDDGTLDFEHVSMEKNKVYNIPMGLWHNTITQKDTKLILIEDSNTSMDNSEVRNLNEEEIRQLRDTTL
jgi:mannose-6-phosphate isomerase-like protein (cupin superfamily)